MKKTILAMLLTSSLLLGGCTVSDTTTEEDSTTGNAEAVLPDDPAEDNAYLEIERRENGSFQKLALSFHSVPFSLTVSLPEDWELIKAADASYLLLRQDEEIGKIFKGEATDLAEWKSVAKRTSDLSGFLVEEHIEKSGSGDTLAFRFRYFIDAQMKEKSAPVTIVADYAEVSKDSAFRLLNHATVDMVTGGARLGDLSELQNGSIAILGNSFVASSQVGSILKSMVNQNGKKLTVSAQSRGYATVGTYAQDSSLLSSIRSGAYDAIFLCGFYSASEVSNLSVIKKACAQSGTQLILFPAHNEKRNVISSAITSNNDLYLMDWKQEIDLLIEGGVDRWEMCVDDQHDHSTPLAGYVGAHMIYRAIYGTLPDINQSYSQVSMFEVKSLLADYIRTGVAGDEPIYLD